MWTDKIYFFKPVRHFLAREKKLEALLQSEGCVIIVFPAFESLSIAVQSDIFTESDTFNSFNQFSLINLKKNNPLYISAQVVTSWNHKDPWSGIQ